MNIRPLEPRDRSPLAELLNRVENFSRDEVVCALELIDAALQTDKDYWVLVAEHDGALAGYICFGPTPMPSGTFDLYWIATDPNARGKGAGRALVTAMETALTRRGGRLIRVETSALEAYGPTRGFYAALKYAEEARFRDFYKPGEDLVILSKRLPAAA